VSLGSSRVDLIEEEEIYHLGGIERQKALLGRSRVAKHQAAACGDLRFGRRIADGIEQ